MADALPELLYRAAKANRNYPRPLSLLLQRALGRAVVTVADRGTGLRFACRRGADRMLGEVFHARVYDVPTVPVRAGDWVVDVGANHGFAACYFAHRGARVVALEPDPETYRRLLGNVAANGLEGRVETHACAVGGEEGRALLHISRELGGGMSTIHEGFAGAAGITVVGTVEVRVRGLAGILAGIPAERVRLLKLDCEGSELEILRSLAPAERERIDAIALEVHREAYPLAELVDLVLGWGDFHLSQAQTLDWRNANLHLVRARALAEWAGAGGRG